MSIGIGIGAKNIGTFRRNLFFIEGVLGSKTYLAIVDVSAQNLGYAPFQTPSAILG